MHVMEESSDALVCSDAKIVSLKTTSANTAAVKVTPEEAVAVDKQVSEVTKVPKTKEPITSKPLSNQTDPVAAAQSPEPAAVPSVGADSVTTISESKKNEENKENMTVKDNSKEQTPAKLETEGKVKAKEDISGKEICQSTNSDDEAAMDEVMEDIDDFIADVKYQNGSKADFNEDLTFQVDGEKDQHDEEEDAENDTEEDEEGAVDLSSYDANRSDREDDEKYNQTDESSAVELIESSPEKEALPLVTRRSEKNQTSAKIDKGLVSGKSAVPNQPEVKHAEEKPSRRQEKTADPVIAAKKSSPSREEKHTEKRKEVESISRKRRRSVDQEEDPDDDAEAPAPSKKLKRELENNYHRHDRLLKEYIETTSNESVDDIQKHTDALVVEIQTLNDMIRAKEVEWNNMIHLKKVKEEILLRLTRKKHVIDIIDTKLGEVSEYTHFDSSNLTNVRSASVGPRPPTPPPEVDIRPASVNPVHSSTLNTSKNVTSNTISSSRHQSMLGGSKDNNLFAQFNHSNSSVTMVPLSTSPSLITSTNTILQSRANMKSAEVAKEKSNAVQIQRQILPKPILSNHQQILNNLAMSAGLTAAAATSSGATSISNSGPAVSAAAAAFAANNILAGLSAQAAALLNGHHNPSVSNHISQSSSQAANQLQVGRQGVIKDVKSIIADYRQKHPEQVPRRGRRLKNIPSTGYDGITITNKSGTVSSSRMSELGFLLAAAEDDEADDDLDRLVIDEGDDHRGTSGVSRADGHHREREPSVVITTRGGNGHENEVPECQGCKKREAQFVCAGCGNQWYCSRECQVNAWDDHSEVCTG